MESPPAPAPPSPPPSSAAEPPSEAEQTREEREEEKMVHKTKLIQFLGRTTPIVLQNDNGPCPLLAICNVLLLKNSLNLSPDSPEVSQEKLLSLVAERLIDSNSNIDNKDAGYLENQQQNIADAIDLLPRLATGIDVNIKFRRIDDFEFTPECAIFDLLDIPLYHGWIVDPQDYETADAIGPKSYNTLVGELVSLETESIACEHKKSSSEDDCVDFAAATTAALGVPSPCLSRGMSFNDSSDNHKPRKGDVEEEAQLLRALKLSESQISASSADDVVTDGCNSISVSNTSTYAAKSSEPVISSELVEVNASCPAIDTGTLMSDNGVALDNYNIGHKSPEAVAGKAVDSLLETDQDNNYIKSTPEECSERFKNTVDRTGEAQLENGNTQPLPSGQDSASSVLNEESRRVEEFHNELTSTSDANQLINNQSLCRTADSSSLLTSSDSSSGQIQKIEKPETLSASVTESEPLYEGEDCILESGPASYENKEPVYEGEVVLAEQVDRDCIDVGDSSPKDKITPKQGELISNFLKNTASQLTIYGLFCLQDKVKERELCVFFRNNHFSTMFKYEGQLYILATDQGFINQPDLVWEKLNEVNGDTLYMTGNFKEFKMEEQSSNTWDEQNAMASTADYLANIDNAAQEHSTFNSDLQLAIALQQQEFEQQQPQPQRNMQQPAISSGSRLVTGPQVSQSSGKHTSSSSKQESKSKADKCVVM